MRRACLLALAAFAFIPTLALAAEPAAPPSSVQFLNSNAASDLPFSEAVRVGDTLYLSGKLGTLPGTRTLAPGGFQAEARQVMLNIQATLEAHGFQLSQLVKCTVMLADMADWPAFNEVYTSLLKKPYPARSAFGTNGLALGAKVEVECIAAVGR